MTPTPDDVARAEALLGVDYRTFPGDLERNAEIIAEAREAGAKAERERIVAMLDTQSDAHFRAMADDESHGVEKSADIQRAIGRALCDLSGRIENHHPKATT